MSVGHEPNRYWLTPALAIAISVVISSCGIDVGDLDDGPTTQTYEQGDESGPIDDAAAIAVERVVDGDSLEVTQDGAELEVRLVGYNAPELYRRSNDGPDEITCNGQAAKDGVGGFLADSSTVALVTEGEDRFGRTLGDVVVDDELLVPQLIHLGYGMATGDSPGNRQLMKEAAEARIGIWGDECGLADDLGLRLGDVQVDAPGNDRSNLNDEWVQLVNDGSNVVTLDGWVLRDDTTSHQFELVGSLDPGATLTVRTGSGRSDESANGDRTVYLDERFPVWSNDQETIVLVDPAGVFVDWRFTEG